MTDQIDLGGAIYISSKRAAEITGYSQDYIGQLARSATIIAQRVSGLWYIEEKSLRAHKERADEYRPVPPTRDVRDLEAAVTFDGKDYVSTARAAKITGYNPDYVSQLARAGKVLSRQVGNRWYVDREGLVAHKDHNDSLLAAVQADSVGLERQQISPEIRDLGQESHFNYIQENAPLIPVTPEKPEIESSVFEQAAPLPVVEPEDPVLTQEEEHQIPIRVLEPVRTMPRFQPSAEYMRLETSQSPQSRKLLVTAVFAVVLATMAGGGYAVYTKSGGSIESAVTKINMPIENLAISADSMPAAAVSAASKLQDLFSRKLEYQRSSN